MKKNFLFSLLLVATCLFSASAQTLISEDFSSTAWGTELLRLNPTYVKPATNADFFGLSTTSLYFSKYALDGAIVTHDGVTPPNYTNVCALFATKGIVHNNGGKAVAFRFRNSGITSFMEFPQITSAGNITLHVRNGNATVATTLTLQKYVSGAWTTITTLAVGRADAYYATKIDQILTYNININSPVKLRIYGGDKFIMLFRVDIEAHYKVALLAAINSATAVKNASTSKIGGGIGQYTQASYDALVAAIAAANTVNANGSATQAQVDAALATLNTAVAVFQASVIPAKLIDIDFTRDSVSWKSKFPATTWNGYDQCVTVSGTQIDSYSFKGTFGRFFAGAGTFAQPGYNNALSIHRRWALRLDYTNISYIQLPALSSAGKMTIWCKNGSETLEGVFYIQQLVGSTWTTIKTIYAPPHFGRNYEQQVQEYININSAVTLRIYGSTKTNHVYQVVVNSYDATKPAEKPLKLVLLPDPQAYANNVDLRPVYASQAIWIAANSDNIKFVACQGDMTQTNEDDQWSIAAGALTIMHGVKVPFTFIPGNHDMGSPGFANTRNTTMLNTYLPYSRYSRDPSFGGVYEANKMENSWSTFSRGSYNFLILSLEYGPRDKIIDWAKTVIAAHPYYNIIINTHAYLGSSNGHFAGGIPQAIGDLTGAEHANDGQQMWDKLVKLYKNVMFVFCGHFLDDGTGNAISTGNNGNKIYEFMANYQGGVDGTELQRNGMLRIVDMDPENHTLNIQTYSPYSNTYRTESDQHFSYTNVQYMKNNGQYVKGEVTGVEESYSEKIKIAMEGKNLRIINDTGNPLTTVVYTMQGIKILQRSGTDLSNISLPASGCYIVSISDKSEINTLRRKIIVP